MIVLDVNASYAMVDRTDEGCGLRMLLLEGEKVIAPMLFCSEAANVAWKVVRFGGMSRDCSAKRLAAALDQVDEFYGDNLLLNEALGEALRHGHPVCDMFYLVLARRTGATLFTLDKKLMGICRDAGVNCVELVALSA